MIESSNTLLTCGLSAHNRASSVMKSPSTKTADHTITRFALSTYMPAHNTPTRPSRTTIALAVESTASPFNT